MPLIDEKIELPNKFYINTIKEIIKNEGFEEFKTNITVVSSKGENYFGTLYRIKVMGKKKEISNAELNLIIKIPPLSPEIREKFHFNKIYTRECFVYNVVLPELNKFQNKYKIPETDKFHFVKSYRACSKDLKEFILMDDMNSHGYYMGERRISLSYNQLKIVLKNIASFHALSFVLKLVNPEKYNFLVEHLGGVGDYNQDYLNYFELSKDRAIGVMNDPILTEKLKIYGVNLKAKLNFYLRKESADNYTVICHGDILNNNILFKYENGKPADLRFIDWQVAREASPVTDIAYLIFNSTDEDLRKKHFKEMMDHYHGCLGNSLEYMGYNVDECYPKAVFEDHLKKFLPFGLLMAFMVLPAVLGEAEDVLDMEYIVKKDKVQASDLNFKTKASSDRYDLWMRGVVRTLIDLNIL